MVTSGFGPIARPMTSSGPARRGARSRRHPCSPSRRGPGQHPTTRREASSARYAGPSGRSWRPRPSSSSPASARRCWAPSRSTRSTSRGAAASRVRRGGRCRSSQNERRGPSTSSDLGTTRHISTQESTSPQRPALKDQPSNNSRPPRPAPSSLPTQPPPSTPRHNPSHLHPRVDHPSKTSPRIPAVLLDQLRVHHPLNPPPPTSRYNASLRNTEKRPPRPPPSRLRGQPLESRVPG